MVLFINGANEANDHTVVAKMMYNIGRNKSKYLPNGKLNKKKPNSPFNKYVHQDVEYNITANMGVVVIFADDFDIRSFIRGIINAFGAFDIDNSKYPYGTYGMHTTHYTMVSKKSKSHNVSFIDSSRRLKHKINGIVISTELNLESKISCRFLWYIHHETLNNPYMRVQELSSHIPSELFLNRSLTTIVYDKLGVYSAKNGLKQMDYPSIDQYNYKFNNFTVILGATSGIDKNIIKAYDKKVKLSYMHLFDTTLKKFAKWSSFKITHRNPQKTIFEQLQSISIEQTRVSQVDDSQVDDSQVDDSKCFFTQSPLYGTVYVIHISRVKERSVSINIAVNPCAWIWGGKLLEKFSSNGINFTSIYEVKYDRSESDVIKMIPNINPVKRDILLCMSTNGVCVVHEKNKKYAITYNNEKNIIYLGLGNMYAIHSLIYKQTPTVLFHVEFE